MYHKSDSFRLRTKVYNYKFSCKKFLSIEEKAMNPNRTAMATMTSAYTLDDIAKLDLPDFIDIPFDKIGRNK